MFQTLFYYELNKNIYIKNINVFTDSQKRQEQLSPEKVIQ